MIYLWVVVWKLPNTGKLLRQRGPSFTQRAAERRVRRLQQHHPTFTYYAERVRLF